jgi:RimJ/RimL family protein N-acetyltransferase
MRLETERLLLTHLEPADAGFILELLNEPSWLRFIGDRNVHTLDEARHYIENGPMAMYAEKGYGLYRVALKNTVEPIGICGLIKRDTLPEPDIGFAFVPRAWGAGYAREASLAVIEQGRREFGLVRLLGITDPENERSIRLLERLGLREQRRMTNADGRATLVLGCEF